MRQHNIARQDQPNRAVFASPQLGEVEACLERAQLGDPDAMFELALIFSTGEGAVPDYVTAHKWFNLAAAAGQAEARIMRTELAATMSGAEIAEAQSQARAWQVRRAH